MISLFAGKISTLLYKNISFKYDIRILTIKITTI